MKSSQPLKTVGMNSVVTDHIQIQDPSMLRLIHVISDITGTLEHKPRPRYTLIAKFP